MGTEKYVSEVKVIDYPVDKVYDRLANLKNLENLFDPEKINEIRNQVKDAQDIKLDNFQATEDECSFTVKSIGKVGVRIIERDPGKMIKLKGSESLPIDISCWLQLLSVDENSCKVRLTLHAEMNPMIKMMVNKHLKEGVNKIADALTRISYA